MKTKKVTSKLLLGCGLLIGTVSAAAVDCVAYNNGFDEAAAIRVAMEESLRPSESKPTCLYSAQDNFNLIGFLPMLYKQVAAQPRSKEEIYEILMTQDSAQSLNFSREESAIAARIIDDQTRKVTCLYSAQDNFNLIGFLPMMYNQAAAQPRSKEEIRQILMTQDSTQSLSFSKEESVMVHDILNEISAPTAASSSSPVTQAPAKISRPLPPISTKKSSPVVASSSSPQEPVSAKRAPGSGRKAPVFPTTAPTYIEEQIKNAKTLEEIARNERLNEFALAQENAKRRNLVFSPALLHGVQLKEAAPSAKPIEAPIDVVDQYLQHVPPGFLNADITSSDEDEISDDWN